MVDAEGRARLAVEVKFGAGLTRHQPLGYLDGLTTDVPSALIFVVSTRQIAGVTTEVLHRLQAGRRLPSGDYGSLVHCDADGSRVIVLHGNLRVALMTELGLVRALRRAGLPDEQLHPLEGMGEQLGQRWQGQFTHVEQLLAAGPSVKAVAQEVGAVSLCDWPYSGAQRMHALYRDTWCVDGSRLPACAISLGWQWGTRLNGGDSGNDNRRPYVTVAVLDKRYREPVLHGLSGHVPGGGRAEPATLTYPAWFYLPPVAPDDPDGFDSKVRQALVEACRCWAPVLDAALHV